MRGNGKSRHVIKVFPCLIILIKVRINAVHMAMSYLEYNPNQVDIEILLRV